MKYENIEKSRLFQGMTAKELSSCLDSLDAREKKYRKDDVILHAGDKTNNIGMVLSGSVTIESNEISTLLKPTPFLAKSFWWMSEQMKNAEFFFAI